jgi:hypothetical protein
MRPRSADSLKKNFKPRTNTKRRENEGLQILDLAESLAAQPLEQDAPSTTWSKMLQLRGKSGFFPLVS